MASEIVRHDVQGLIDGWIEAERNGEQFPVDFDLAWSIAGYKQKQHAKRKLTGKTSPLKEEKDYLSRSGQSTLEGRSSDQLKMTCDALKHFCLMAQTSEGAAIRDYFIDAEKKWKLVQQHAPNVASDIEVLHLKIELAKQEAIKAVAEEKVLSIRQYVTQSCPESVQQKIFGCTEIRTVEYRDRVIHNDDVIRNGDTINKTEMCRRLGLVSKSGSPNYKQLNQFLLSADIPTEAWELTVSLRENEELKSEHWQDIEHKWIKSDRNLFLGE